ncbi:DUF1127 domain-containing protein [Chachezhania antarctica]|uniref:DUF1127 domain-containing protein n=1 Tax=Chachezhania antarctica TaxID=2340860 RepID=UPI000EAE8254|nr:DUF1127 domain-containing protein [Chachezhania antarctica]|tara:strand:+ start:350 stop:550 length:201 start_codon:yes stop_codon:yes gene_type:complete
MTMFMTDTTLRAPRTSVRRTLARLWAAQRQAAKMRRDYRRLQDMPDYLLADVGLTRGDIPRRRWPV